MNVGIVGYGAFIPRKRITSKEISLQWGKDPEVIAACDELGMPMIFTGRRHFKH